jgi:hypothetical protein
MVGALQCPAAQDPEVVPDSLAPITSQNFTLAVTFRGNCYAQGLGSNVEPGEVQFSSGPAFLLPVRSAEGDEIRFFTIR